MGLSSQLQYNKNSRSRTIILSNFSLSKPVESLQACISMASFRHHACVHMIIEQAGGVRKVRDFDGCYKLSDHDVNRPFA